MVASVLHAASSAPGSRGAGAPARELSGARFATVFAATACYQKASTPEVLTPRIASIISSYKVDSLEKTRFVTASTRTRAARLDGFRGTAIRHRDSLNGYFDLSRVGTTPSA